MTRDLDPRMTFETFVVGPANRLAAAAARRAADSPGTSYNPLFIYSPSGLGKSHILTAIAHHASKVHPEAKVVYQTMEGYLDELAEALEAGERDRLKEQYAGLDIFLLDDVQFLSGQPEAQELLLRTLDTLSVSGSQIALASDRPPAEIDALDDRLLSRFSGGLIVDIAQPEFETRVAIIRRKAEERGMDLEDGVAEAIARHPVKNVRELGGALNRVFAVQDLEDRRVTSEEIPELLGVPSEPAGERRGPDEFGTFVDELSADLASTVRAQEAPWRVLLRETAEKAEEDGFRTGRLRRLLERDEEPADVQETVEQFLGDLERLQAIEEELEAVGNPWPDAAATVLNDPERIDEAEALLASAQERSRPFPEVPDGPELGHLAGRISPLAVKAAAKLVEEGRSEYNPLFVWSEGGDLARILLEATARGFQKTRERSGRVALISASEFAGEFIEALSSGVAGAWRERWWEVDLLLVYGLEALSHTERAQDEFFHLFEALKRREAWVMLAADRPPTGIANVDERLRSRFEGGLVIEVEEIRPEPTEEPAPEPVPEPAAQAEKASEGAGTGVGPGPGTGRSKAPG
ncbi:MAG: DnaA ATPase domain-containing protein, partial [Gemmatimonadota bacterium]